MVWSSEEARDVLQRVLAYGTAEHVEVTLGGAAEGATRFANNIITQNQARSDVVLRVRAAFGQRVGQAQTNQFSEESLRQTAERAETLARHAEPDPEYLPPPSPPQGYPQVQAFDAATARCTPAERAETILAAVAPCRAAGLRAAGSFATSASFRALLNSNGLYAYHRQTDARFAATVMTADSSGKAEAVHYGVAHLSPTTVVEEAREKAERAQQPRSIEPGTYTVILEPAATAGLIEVLGWSLDAKAAFEGRSAFAGKEGSSLLDGCFDLRSQADFPLCPGVPFQGDGMPTPTVHWFRQGCLQTLLYNRYQAQQHGRPFTGSPTNLIMENGNKSLQQLVEETERGLLITRFWYIRFVDPMQLLLTGMTRDGLFWVEGGVVRYGVKNLRFNDSPLRTFARIEALGAGQWVGEYSNLWMPAVRLERFHFDSATTF